MNTIEIRARAARPAPGRARWVSLLLIVMVLGLQVVLGGSAAAAGACDDAPNPDAWNAGMSGAIDPAIGQGTPGVGGYREYGYSGQIWRTYDLGNSMIGCADAHADIDTGTGNMLFNGAKVLVATANSLHYLVYTGGIGTKLDDAVKIGSSAAYGGFAVPFLSIALLIMAIIMFKAVFAGKLAESFSGGARVGIAVTFIAATALSPMFYSQIFDNLLVDGVHQIDEQMNKTLYGDNVIYRDVMPSTLAEQIVYKNWLAGEFGSADSPAAQQQGLKLLDAQAFTWAQIVKGDDGKAEVIDGKKAEFKQVAEAVKSTSSYNTFTGSAGNRAGTGALALTEAALFTPLQIVAKVGWLFAQIVLRLVVLFGPMIGMFLLVNGVWRTVFRGVLGVGMLGFLFWAVANIDTMLLKNILESNQTLTAKLVLMLLINGLIWTVLRPVRRLRSMVVSGMYTVPGQGMHRAADWFRHARLMRAMRNGSRGKYDRWHPWGDRRRKGGADVEDAVDGPSTIYADAVRHEAVRQPVDALAGGAAGDGGSGSTGGPGGRPGSPRGGAPAGSGVYFANARTTDWHVPEPGTVRAEAIRLRPWTPAPTDRPYPGVPGSSSATGELPGSSMHELPGTRRHALPSGTAESDPYVVEQSSTGDRSEIVTPESIEARDQGHQIPEAPSRTDGGGERVYDVYDPERGFIQVSEEQIRSMGTPRSETRDSDQTRPDTNNEGGN